MKKIDRKKIEDMCVSSGSTIRQAMEVISRGEIGSAFVVHPQTRVFQGVVTDGDIRRAILKGSDLEAMIETIARPKAKTARRGIKPEEISMMFNEKIRVIPILDLDNRIVDIALYDQRFHLPVAEPLLGEKELEYVSDCIMSNWVSSTGKYVTRFESLFADYCGSAFGLATCNGTAALHLALLALDIGPGDEVLVPSLTFIATANAVTYTGAKPVFIDSERQTWNMDPAKLQAAITAKTKAIIPVHLYGHPADMDPILEIAKRNKLSVIEDAAEAHGGEYKGKKVGSIGDIGIFSFFGNKIITTGEGGMIVSDNADLIQKMKLLRDHGMSPERRYWHPVLGYNYRLTNIQAAIGVAQTERIESIVHSKIKIAARYERQLSDIKGLVCPPKQAWAKNVYWLYSILIEKEFGMTRDELIGELTAMGIDTRPFFPPCHTQPIYQDGTRLDVAEELAVKGLNLPSSVGLHEQEIDRICAVIRTVYAKVQSKTYA